MFIDMIVLQFQVTLNLWFQVKVLVMVL